MRGLSQLDREVPKPVVEEELERLVVEPARPGKSHPRGGVLAARSPGIEVTDEQARMCLQAGPKSRSMPSRSSMLCQSPQFRPDATTALVPYRPATVDGAGSG
jgi:hypothetical protein